MSRAPLAAPYALSALLMAAACAQLPPAPRTPALRSVATFVSANFDLTWTAAIDHLHTLSIPIASIDRSSGQIVTERVGVDPSQALEYADCGTSQRETVPLLATSALYTVAVGDDGRSSSVLFTAEWEARDPALFRCETTLVWEGEAQEAVKLAAEVNR